MQVSSMPRLNLLLGRSGARIVLWSDFPLLVLVNSSRIATARNTIDFILAVMVGQFDWLAKPPLFYLQIFGAVGTFSHSHIKAPPIQLIGIHSNMLTFLNGGCHSYSFQRVIFFSSE